MWEVKFGSEGLCQALEKEEGEGRMQPVVFCRLGGENGLLDLEKEREM